MENNTKTQMEGYLVTFFTQRNREYQNQPIARWIVEEAKKLGVGGATLFSGKEGFGHDGHFHSDNYFDYEDPPQQVTMALRFDEYETLMAILKENKLRVFFTRSRVDFGYTYDR